MDCRKIESSGRGVATTLALAFAIATICCQARGADTTSGTPAADGAAPGQADQAAAGTAKPVDSAAAAKCQKAAAAFGQRSGDATLLGSAEARAVGMQNPDLVMCTAVLTDSDEPCNRYLPTEKGPSNACLQLRAMFHELKTYPGKPTYVFTDFDWQACRSTPEFKESCDKLRAALRAGNEKGCAGIGIGEPLCRAAISGDKTKCDVKVAAADSMVWHRDPGDKGPAAANIAEFIAKDCHEKLDTRGPLAVGLKKIADSGSGQQQILARAALGQQHACSELVDQAVARCGPSGKESAGESTPASTPRPAPQEP